MTQVSSKAHGTSLLDAYSLNAAVYDEMFDAQRAVRPHWNYVAQALGGMGRDELKRRHAEIRRVIRDNDVTYNIYSDPRGMSRPWGLDVFPMLVCSQEWSQIEKGLSQRAELLNALLIDLYGPRTVVKQKILPPELVFADANFCWPLDGFSQSPDHALLLYAADLVRSPSGELLVLSQRTQAPSGAGYALENRVVFSQVMPSMFRDAHVHRLRGYFRSLRSALAGLAAKVEDPRIVLLTPGVNNEAYFEHAYLANYLGFTLVHGSDLVVRDSRVWLKTLDDVQPVDVILRRVDDSYCDPVELRADSILGVPGLVQAIRAGNVVVANPLGSGIVQNPALTQFLPRLCQFFLGEDLILPSVETHWCGSPTERSHVIENLQNFVIKTVRANVPHRTTFGWELSQLELDTLRAQIKARPNYYSAQSPLQCSTAPVLTDGGSLEPRHTVLRSFLVREADGYRVMPGGLTRVAARAEQLMVSNQQGGTSKDTWVLASEPEKDESVLIVSGRALQVSRQYDELSSRVADNLYWVGRYAERAEGLIRLLRVILDRLNEDWMRGTVANPSIKSLLLALTHQSMTYPGFTVADNDELIRNPQPELLSVIASRTRIGSLAQSLGGLLHAARSVRDRLSSDMRRIVNDIDEQYWALQRFESVQLVDMRDNFDLLVNHLVGLTGLISENMTREPGWYFITIGRRLERALNSAALLRTGLTLGGAATSPDNRLLDCLLHAMDSAMTYRRRYPSGLQLEAVVDLLVFDDTNPRALNFQLADLAYYTGQLSIHKEVKTQLAEEKILAELLAKVRDFDQSALVPGQSQLGLSNIQALLDAVRQQLPAYSDHISTKYFCPEAQAQPLAPRVT